MPEVTLIHFQRAAADIGAHGDNDTLPFDIDNRFIAQRQNELSQAAFDYFNALQKDSEANSEKSIKNLSIFSERLLVPTGPTGFRITTKIHPFWNIYFNGLGVAIADALEDRRDHRTHSYRFLKDGDQQLFNRDSSWKSFREATIADCEKAGNKSIVIQTDISSFYGHVSHHYIENSLEDLFPTNKRVAKQLNALLGKFSAGRSFGLPVGGQCSRILAELFLWPVDSALSEARIEWRRYVDDYVLIANSHADAYKALSVLSHSLADYGLSLNKTKTTILTSKHYVDYVKTQLGGTDDEAGRLREIDLHFDPYSDTADDDYESLKKTVEGLEVQKLLSRELEKAQPDTFMVSQIGRTLRLQPPEKVIEICLTLLSQINLYAFRASWSTIMRGISAVRADEKYVDVFPLLDTLLDEVPDHSPHLLHAESSLLHYLRTIRFSKTLRRANFVRSTYENVSSRTVRRACIDCWRKWSDRQAFTSIRNRWNEISPDEQRIMWLMSFEFGDEGENFRRQNQAGLDNNWRLGIERQSARTFSTIYKDWCNASHADT
jgi:Reverse transcriptase (RNA-dependent DNA polymerase)